MASNYLISSCKSGGGLVIERDPIANTWTVIKNWSLGFTPTSTSIHSPDGVYVAVAFSSTSRLVLGESTDGGATWAIAVDTASYRYVRGVFAKGEDDVAVLASNTSNDRVLLHWNGVTLSLLYNMTAQFNDSDEQCLHGLGNTALALSEKYTDLTSVRLYSGGAMSSPANWVQITRPYTTNRPTAVYVYGDNEIYVGTQIGNQWYDGAKKWNGASWVGLGRHIPSGTYISVLGFAKRGLINDPTNALYAGTFGYFIDGAIYTYNGGIWTLKKALGTYVRPSNGCCAEDSDTVVFGGVYYSTGEAIVIERRFGIDADWNFYYLKDVIPYTPTNTTAVTSWTTPAAPPSITDEYITTINTIPEDGETDVPVEELLRLHVVSVGGIALDETVKVYVTRGHEGTRRLAYDQAAGGFQAPYNGANSLATVVSSPGSSVTDELWLQIDYTDSYYSLESVLVEVYASISSGVYSYYHTYSFTIEDLTAPEIEELLWYDPWTCRIKFDEPVSTSATIVGGSAYVVSDLGSAQILGVQGENSSQVRLPGVTLTGNEAGLWLQLAGSAYPENHTPREITSVDVTAAIITVDVTSAGYLKADDGRDYDESGILVRERALKGAVSPYCLEARLASEGASGEALSPDRIQCAFCPIPISATVPSTDELPTGADYRQYVTVTFEQDVSYGRLYTLHAQGVADIWGNRPSDATIDFESPTFGAPTDRLQIWSNGLIPPPDRTEDLERNALLRKVAVVLQDAFNMMWYRVDQMKYMDDADKCPSSWVKHLLYNRGNPFRFELENEDQERLLAAALPGFYKQTGTAANIIEMIRLLTGVTVTINAFVSSDYWVIGFSSLALLPLPTSGTTILAPTDSYVLNSYEIISPVDLTTRQRRIITDVATWADPLDMHLIRIVEPSTGIGVTASYWTLNVSSLGISTIVGS